MVIVPPQAVARRESWFEAFPLLMIAVIVYNVAAWGGAAINGAATVQAGLARGFSVPMPASDAIWFVSMGDLVIWISLVLLFIEILRSTGIGKASVANHAFSILVFVVCLVEFILFEPFATSVFFAITLMTLLDVIAGFVISVMTARRDFAVGAG